MFSMFFIGKKFIIFFIFWLWLRRLGKKKKVVILVVVEVIFREEVCVFFEVNFGDVCSGNVG